MLQEITAELTIEVAAEVTHPAGTVFDADGNPIAPEGTPEGTTE